MSKLTCNFCAYMFHLQKHAHTQPLLDQSRSNVFTVFNLMLTAHNYFDKMFKQKDH